jgi:hypothetical protein
MKAINSKLIIACAVSLCTAAALMLASCGNSDSSKSDSSSAKETETASAEETADSSETEDGTDGADDAADSKYNVGGDYEAPESLKTAAASYDPDGDSRMYDVLKDEFGGDFLIELASDDSSMKFNVKDDLVYGETVVGGMMSRAYYLADKSFYNISDATTTYVMYTDYDFDTRNADPLFGATEDFVSAEINSDGNISETYGLDSDFTGVDGNIVFTFNSETGALMNYAVVYNSESDTETVIYAVNSLANADESLFELPDLSAYNQNGASGDSTDSAEAED